jgi:hypothetical protein
MTCARNTNTWTCQHAWVGTVTQCTVTQGVPVPQAVAGVLELSNIICSFVRLGVKVQNGLTSCLYCWWDTFCSRCGDMTDLLWLHFRLMGLPTVVLGWHVPCSRIWPKRVPAGLYSHHQTPVLCVQHISRLLPCWNQCMQRTVPP